MATLITGSQGFLGQALVSELILKSNPVIALTRQDCDLMHLQDTKDYFSAIQPNLIIHCAAFVPTSLSEYENTELSQHNSQMLKNILSATSCPIIYISSMTVYGPSSNIIKKESERPQPQSAYAVSKYQGEELLKSNQRNSLAIRIPGLFGVKRSSGLVYNNTLQLLNSNKFSVPDKPLLWAAMDVQDAAECITKVIEQHTFNGFDVINVGYDETYSINRLIDIFQEIKNEAIEIDNYIEHPKFRFCLNKLKQYNALPKSTLLSAINKLRNQLC